MNISIETAKIDDHYAINLIVKEGQDEHSEALPYIFNMMDQAMPESYYRELLENPNCGVLIAKNSGEVVGFAVMELNESPAFDSMVPRKFAYE